MEQIVLALITFFAGTVQAISGFAFGIIFVGFGQHVIKHIDILALNAVISISFLFYLTVYYRKHINLRVVLVPVIVTGFTLLIAQRCYRQLGGFPYWKTIIGIFFVILGCFMMFASEKIRIQPTMRNGVICGGFTGVLQGFFGIGGPPMTLYLLATTKTKEEYLGSGQFFYLVMCVIDFVGRLVNHMVSENVWRYCPTSFIGMVLGITLGTLILKKLDAEFLRKIVYLIVILDGLYMIGM